MANIKSAKKRILVNEQKRVKNQAFKSAMRTTIKEFDKKIDLTMLKVQKQYFYSLSKK
ncbi:SSU ribosomal protein S20p [Geomicrobium sp. JCM 19055]|nr:SSU ribosomal protein S20p [Geomicrobium sp. JCM 19055]